MTQQDRTETSRAVLGIKGGASAQDIKAAFRRKAAALHPDLHPGDPVAAEAFKKVTAAYEHLKSLAREERKKPAKKNTVTQPAPGARKASGTAAPKKAASLPMEELLLRARHSQNVYVRLHAVRAIGEAGGKAGVWALVQALEDSDRRVVSEAVMALGGLRARIAAMPLIQLHKKDIPVLRRQIEWSLERIGSPIAENYLRKIAPKDGKQQTDADRAQQAAKNNFNIA